MFNDIGKKIKGLAKFFFALEAIFSIIGGIVLILMGADMWSGGEIFITLGIFCIIVGPILAWLSSLLLYGFGELIDKTCDIELNMRRSATNSETQKETLSLKSQKETVKIAKCEICEKENVPVVECKIKDKLGTRYRNMCEDCRKEYDAYI